MKVKRVVWGEPMSVEDELVEWIKDSTSLARGDLETLKERVDALQEMTIRFIASSVKDVDQLNDLVGYKRWVDGNE